MNVPGGPAPDGPDDSGAKDRAERAAWGEVRRGGRLAFHVLFTVLTVVVWVGGEVAGNLLFRSGTIRVADLTDDVIAATLLGNGLAWLFWRRGDARSA